MHVVECQNLTKSYPIGFSRRQRKAALQNISFTVEEGEVFGIIGPNGAGKSTTIKILMGFITADSGQALIQGHPSGSVISRKEVGYLPENPNLYGNLTLTEHLHFASQLTNFRSSDKKEQIRRIIQKVDLSEAADIPIKKYSKGMTQRAALAYALIGDPKILIMDEPMSGLDPLGRQLIIDIIKEYYERGITILFCSHILTDVERICDRIAIMDKSKLITITSPESVQNDYQESYEKMGKSPLESFFLSVVEGNHQ